MFDRSVRIADGFHFSNQERYICIDIEHNKIARQTMYAHIQLQKIKCLRDRTGREETHDSQFTIYPSTTPTTDAHELREGIVHGGTHILYITDIMLGCGCSSDGRIYGIMASLRKRNPGRHRNRAAVTAFRGGENTIEERIWNVRESLDGNITPMT